MSRSIVGFEADRVQFRSRSSTGFEEEREPASHIAIMIIEMLATKVAIEAKAAMSRIKSVIIVSLGSLCFHFVLFMFGSQQKNRTETTILDIPALLVNESLTLRRDARRIRPLAIL